MFILRNKRSGVAKNVSKTRVKFTEKGIIWYSYRDQKVEIRLQGKFGEAKIQRGGRPPSSLSA